MSRPKIFASSRVDCVALLNPQLLPSNNNIVKDAKNEKSTGTCEQGFSRARTGHKAVLVESFLELVVTWAILRRCIHFVSLLAPWYPIAGLLQAPTYGAHLRVSDVRCY